MARLIYIPEVSEDTFLHLSVLGETVRLRDFSKSPTLEPTPFSPPGLTRQRIEELINQHPNWHRNREPAGQKDPGVTGGPAVAFWHRYVRELNRTLKPVSAEELVRKIDLEKKRHEAASQWWKKVRLIMLVLTALVSLIAAIVALWR